MDNIMVLLKNEWVFEVNLFIVFVGCCGVGKWILGFMGVFYLC